MEKVLLKNGKTAVIRKKLHEGSYIAYYSGPEGESVFVIHEDEIKNKTALPYIFIDREEKRKIKKNGKDTVYQRPTRR